MSHTGMIVAIISVLGSLFLVTRGATFRSMNISQTVRLAGIWAVIIMSLVVIITVLQR